MVGIIFQAMTYDERETITELKKCDFNEIYHFHEAEAEKRRNRTREQKKVSVAVGGFKEKKHKGYYIYNKQSSISAILFNAISGFEL